MPASVACDTVGSDLGTRGGFSMAGNWSLMVGDVLIDLNLKVIYTYQIISKIFADVYI